MAETKHITFRATDNDRKMLADLSKRLKLDKTAVIRKAIQELAKRK